MDPKLYQSIVREPLETLRKQVHESKTHEELGHALSVIRTIMDELEPTCKRYKDLESLLFDRSIFPPWVHASIKEEEEEEFE